MRNSDRERTAWVEGSRVRIEFQRVGTAERIGRGRHAGCLFICRGIIPPYTSHKDITHTFVAGVSNASRIHRFLANLCVAILLEMPE